MWVVNLHSTDGYSNSTLFRKNIFEKENFYSVLNISVIQCIPFKKLTECMVVLEIWEGLFNLFVCLPELVPEGKSVSGYIGTRNNRPGH